MLGLPRTVLFCLLYVLSGFECSLTLSPSQTMLQKFQNTSYTVGCKSDSPDDNLDDIIWRRIQENGEKEKIFVPKGRIHVMRSVGRNSRDARLLLLVFERLEPRDAGRYECYHTGTRAALQVELDVATPITFMDTPEAQEAREASNTTLRCEVAGRPEPEVHWSVDDTPITQDFKFKELGDGLFIQNISRQDAGTYQCKATQSSKALTDRKVKEIKLRVTYKPTFSEEFAQAHGYLNGTANVTCAVSAEPPAEFRWFRLNDRKGKRQVHLRDYPGAQVVNETNRNTLQIPVLHESVFGLFLCEASNKEGRMERKIALKRSAAPTVPTVELGEIRDTSVDLYIQGGEDGRDGISAYRVEFVEKWPGDPLKWTNPFTRDFKRLTSGDPIYCLDQLALDTRYTFRVAARNLAGLSSFSPEQSFQTRATPSSAPRSGVASPLLLAVQWWVVTKINRRRFSFVELPK